MGAEHLAELPNPGRGGLNLQTTYAPELGELRSIPRVKFSPFFTPIEKCERLRQALPGSPHIFIKRDDYSNFLGGGNKLRKLEFTMAEALRRRATRVVTMGSIHSNHARITTMVARRLGLQCSLVLNGDAGAEPKGNFYLSKLLGADLHFVGSREDRMAKMDAVAEALQQQGEAVYKVPLGCSDSTGSIGLVAAMEEVVLQMQELGVQFDAIVLASSSGGTQAGLEAGKRLFGLDRLQIIGISPDDSAATITRTVHTLCQEMISHFGLEPGISEAEVQVYDQYVGPGYGLATEESQEATKLFCQTEGILLDPFYTSKAAAALLDFCRQQRFSSESQVLFWHTGGLVNLFH